MMSYLTYLPCVVISERKEEPQEVLYVGTMYTIELSSVAARGFWRHLPCSGLRLVQFWLYFLLDLPPTTMDLPPSTSP